MLLLLVVILVKSGVVTNIAVLLWFAVIDASGAAGDVDIVGVVTDDDVDDDDGCGVGVGVCEFVSAGVLVAVVVDDCTELSDCMCCDA